MQGSKCLAAGPGGPRACGTGVAALRTIEMVSVFRGVGLDRLEAAFARAVGPAAKRYATRHLRLSHAFTAYATMAA
jgi:hypothetical protein